MALPARLQQPASYATLPFARLLRWGKLVRWRRYSLWSASLGPSSRARGRIGLVAALLELLRGRKAALLGDVLPRAVVVAVALVLVERAARLKSGRDGGRRL